MRWKYMLIEQKIERARLSQSQQLIADYLLEKRSNIKDMVLSDEVVESVKNKQFHIYAIDNVDDGIELLMGQKAGKALASGGFSKDSVHSKVYNKLKNYYKISVQE